MHNEEETLPGKGSSAAGTEETIPDPRRRASPGSPGGPGTADPGDLTGALVANRFRLGALLGRGGFGSVYRARDTRLDRAVAVKLIPASGISVEDRERFAREARATARLQHPNVITIYDSVEDQLGLFLVLELVDGSSLRERIRRGPMPADEALRIARQVLSALTAASDLGIVHRDIKPENLLITAEGKVKVADFGIARFAGAGSLTASGVITGTPSYMAPEQIEGREAGPEADLFALGCVLHELVAGTPPYAAATTSEIVARILAGRPSRLPDGVGSECPWLPAVLNGLLAKEPAARRTAARRLAESAIAGASETRTEALPEIAPAGRARSRRRTAAVAVGALCVALLVLVVARVRRSGLEAEPGSVVLTRLPDFESFRKTYWEHQLGGVAGQVTFQGEGTVAEMLGRLVGGTGVNLVVHTSVDMSKRAASVRLENVSWPAAFGAVLSGTGLVATFDRGVFMVSALDQIQFTSGRDSLFFLEEHRTPPSPPRLTSESISRLGSPAFEAIRMEAGPDWLWQVRDLPEYLAFIVEYLKARGVVEEVQDVQVSSFACRPPDLRFPAKTRALVVRFRAAASGVRDPLVDKTFENVDVAAAGGELASLAGYSVQWGQIRGTVKIALRKVPASRALEVFLRIYGIQWNCVNGVLELFPEGPTATRVRRTRRYQVEGGPDGARELLPALAKDLTAAGELDTEGDGFVRVTDTDEGLLRVETTLGARAELLKLAGSGKPWWSLLASHMR